MSSILTLAGNNTSDASFYSHTIDQSLRFDDGDSARLADTMGTPTDTEKATISVWVKRGQLTGVNQTIIEGYNGSSGTASSIYFDASNRLHVAFGGGGGALTTNAVFRDVSAWYHILVAFNSSKSNSTKRCRIYVNGQEITSFSSSSYPNRYQEQHMFSSGSNHRIGSNWNNSGNFFDGYMAEFNGIDGTGLTPSSFGETKDGIWVPKDVSGLTYGTNGFHLDFADSSAIGNDVSGNDNDWTPSGLAATDVVLDSPTNTFAVMNVLDKNSMTLSEGNLRCTPTGDYKAVRGNFAIPLTGKWFFEARVTTGGGGNITDSQIGIATDQNVLTGTSPYPQTATYAVLYFLSGTIRRLGSAVQTGLSSFAAGDVLGVAINSTDNEVQFYKNGSTVGSAVALPSTTKNSFAFFVGGTSRSSVFNFGQDSTFAGAVSAGSATDGVGTFQSLPTDFKALCSANLDEPAIIDSSEYFNTSLWTGNGGTTTVSDVGFQANFTWIKARSAPRHHLLWNAVSGVSRRLQSSNADPESFTDGKGITEWNSDGFVFVHQSSNEFNTLNQTMVAWNWKAGTAVSGNTTGSGTAKTYTGSVNTEAGFSIVKYVGNGTSGHTIPHNLGTVPKMIIAKNLDQADDWAVYHNAIGAGNYLKLNENNLSTSAAAVWNDTTPSDSVFSVGSNHQTNATDEDYIAYCFADIEGYCKAGSYIGNGSADGQFVYTGFRPAWVMHKTVDTTANHWSIRDNKRDPDNEVLLALYANLTNADDTGGDAIAIDFLSNGFKARRTNSQLNQSGTKYIYLAFAEQPFKYANAR